MLSSGKICYIEVKPKEFIDSPDYQELFSRFEAYLQERRQTFLVVNEIDIYQYPLLSNYEKLYRFRKNALLDMRKLHQYASGISNAIPLSILVAKLSNRVHLKEIYAWIAFGYLRFDMESESLTMNTEVRFHVS